MKTKMLLRIICLTVIVGALAIIISSRIAAYENEKKIAKLEAQKEALLLENQRLEHDLNEDITDAYIIRIMRKLGYYFPGEKNITVSDPEETTEE